MMRQQTNWPLVASVLGGVLLLETEARAQIAVMQRQQLQTNNATNQSRYINSLLTQSRSPFGQGFNLWRQSAAFNGQTQTQRMGMLQAQGFNPWTGFGAINWGPQGGWGAWQGGMNPYMAGMAGFAAGSNPYIPGGGWGGGVVGGFPGFGYPSIPPAGFFLQSAGNVLGASGSIVTGSEEARHLREQSNQSRIETAKKRFDFEHYAKVNTPTFSDEQAKVSRMTLTRLRDKPTAIEIVSGKSSNMILDELRSSPVRKDSETIALDASVLRRLNVTGSRAAGRNLGLLRNEGRFTWPPALQDLIPQTEREEIEVQAQALMQKATDRPAPTNLLSDVQRAVDKMREQLLRKVNELPASQFMEAKRFLNDFDAATRAIQEGDVARSIAFQKWIGECKSAREVVDYMTSKGLFLAPAIEGDEAAYYALHSAIAALHNSPVTANSSTEQNDARE